VHDDGTVYCNQSTCSRRLPRYRLRMQITGAIIADIAVAVIKRGSNCGMKAQSLYPIHRYLYCYDVAGSTCNTSWISVPLFLRLTLRL